ncbi:MAG: glycosyltransferase family 2 protein [Clostridia bacterium]|nr:glycosyltransferase family 2 protein [Clostridia bacterium]
MITVFTPSYNRAYIIDNLYQSLLAQTSKDFEWVVVDDGSKDNTEEYFATIIQNDNPFKITYKKVQNGGKHRAINHGVKMASGELFFIVDSDDYLLPDAIEKILSWVSALDDSKKWAGVSGYRGYSAEKVIGSPLSSPYVDCRNTEREKNGLLGDKAEVYFTSVLREYPFPEIEGENFLTEEVVWNRIAKDGYYLRFYKDIIYVCNYLEDGLTKNSTKAQDNPKGMLIWAKGQFEAFPDNFKMTLVACYAYYAALKGKKSLSKIAKDLDKSVFTVMLAIAARNAKAMLKR